MAGKDGTADTETLFNNSSSIDSILPIYRLELVAVRYDGRIISQKTRTICYFRCGGLVAIEKVFSKKKWTDTF